MKTLMALFLLLAITVPVLAFDGYQGHEGQIPLCQNNKKGALKFAPMKDIDPTKGINYEPYCNTKTETLIWVSIQGQKGDKGDRGDPGPPWNQIATQNIQLNGYWLSNDGGNEGISIDNDGNVTVNEDMKTDRWLNSETNTFMGVRVAGGGLLTHSKDIDGYCNTAFGSESLYSNSTGFGNSAIGLGALFYNSTGFYNTASGGWALWSNTTGHHNVASGINALSYNTTGSWNTALGFQAGVGFKIANVNTTGAKNTFIGAFSGPGTSTQLTNATAIGYGAQVNADNSLVLGGTGTDQVNVGIGTQSPEWMLHVNGTAAKLGGGSWTDSSDIKLKRNVRAIENALGKMLALRGIEFEWNENERARILPGTQMGMIAHEVEGVFPQWVGTDKHGYKDLTFRGFEALAVEAIRELRAENEALKNFILEKEARNKELSDRFSNLERQLLLLEGRLTVSK